MSNWENFYKTEFECPCCGENEIQSTFIDRLQRARSAAGVAFSINSGYRCKRHNATVSDVGEESPHRIGRAADIRVRGSAERFAITKALLDEGFTRIAHKRGMVHVDDAPGKPERVWWWY